MDRLRKVAEDLQVQSKLMEGKEKGDTGAILNIPVTISDFDILSNSKGDYAVFTLKEESNKFFFGGKVVTEHLQAYDREGLKETIQQEGLPVKFESLKSESSGFYYTNCVLFPEDEEK